jgi:hypothetical protein
LPPTLPVSSTAGGLTMWRSRHARHRLATKSGSALMPRRHSAVVQYGQHSPLAGFWHSAPMASDSRLLLPFSPSLTSGTAHERAPIHPSAIVRIRAFIRFLQQQPEAGSRGAHNRESARDPQ